MMKNLCLAGVVALFSAGCASTGSGEATADAESGDDCFYIRQVRNWDAIDDRHIWIEGTGDDQYLLTMRTRCPGIRFTQVIALADRMGRMCPGDFGRVVYRDAGMRMDCLIDNVEAVPSKDEAESIAETRSQLEEN